jgi:MbtH protein
MSDRDDAGFSSYAVVVNGEEQYSIWPADKPFPDGWSPVGKTGPKEDCLRYIKEIWVDMRPLSLRKSMSVKSA